MDLHAALEDYTVNLAIALLDFAPAGLPARLMTEFNQIAGLNL
jgi:hypothetical protein